jgi:signal transduction histidine kinase
LEHVKLDPEQRRHLFLICKEAINNVSRHANCTKVTLHISASGNWLTVEISDNGRGFSTPDNGEPSTNGRGGHGLKNMRGRADELGGHLELDTRPGSGTDIKLRLPLRKR